MIRNLKAALSHTEIGMCFRHRLKNTKPRLKIMPPGQTVDYIEKTGCSVARFGEGEFELILGSDRESRQGVSGFQNRNPELIDRLKEVLASKDPNLLVCIPYALNNIWGRTQDSRNFWYYWSERADQRKRITDLIRSCHGTDKVFGDTQISRPYIA